MTDFLHSQVTRDSSSFYALRSRSLRSRDRRAPKRRYFEFLEERHLLSAPVVSAFPETISHNTPFTFPTSDFTSAFSDADPGDTLQSAQIVSLPAHGTLSLNGTDVTSLQIVPLSDLPGLQYTPAQNYTGADSFGWNGSDGTNFATVGGNVNLTVTNSAPTIADVAKPIGRNSGTPFASGDFSPGFTDTDSGDSIQAVKIISLPTHGTLKLGAAPVTLNQEIAVGSLNSFTYTPDTDFTGSDSFMWNGSDGTAFAAADANMNLTITESAPTLSDVAKNVGTNAVTHFTSADFNAGFTDPDTGDSLKTIEITSLPAHGSLLLNGSAVTAAQMIDIAQIGNFTYTPTTDYVGADSFGWNGSDGAQFATLGAAVNLTVGNTAPVVSNISLALNHNTVLTFTLANFTSHFTDANNDTLHLVTITSLPTYGLLKSNGVPVVTFQQLTAAQLAKLTYTPNKDFAGTDSFNWDGSDGTDYGSSAASVNLTVNGVAPNVSNFNKVGLADANLTFTAKEFSDAFTDPNVGPILQKIKIVTLPTHGTLKLSNVAVTLNQEIDATHIADLTYSPNAAYTGADAFGWNGNNGQLYDTSAATVNLTILPANSLTVSGNGNLIANGQTVTSRTGFTDFGPSSIIVNASIQAVTRTFTIANHTGSTVNLTGAGTHIQITGAAAADFTVTTAPAASVADGATTTFVITFIPSAAGVRSATINIANSVGQPFKFAIVGTGLNTTNGFNGLPALQEAQIKLGSGTPSHFGDVLTMNYTGYLTDGTVFDSSRNPGRTPFQFALGANQVIEGWDPGLIGIAEGEIRDIIIPGAQAYPNGQGNIPAGATLIFEVQCISIGVPRVGVQVHGNTSLITPGAKTASSTEGTDFGALDSSTPSLTKTFDLFSVGYAAGNATAGLSFQSNTNQIVLGGTNASDFVLTHTDGTGTFTVKFNRPATIGTRTATVTVLTNDPVFPAFTFTIAGSAAPYFDLQTSIGVTHFPVTNITSGAGTTLVVPVIVKNLGSAPTTGTTDIQIFAEDTTSHVQTLVTTFTNQNVGGIANNKTKTFNLNVKFPIGFATGNYKLVAKVNSTHSITESDLTNNSAMTTQSVTVIQGLADLTGNLVSTTLPPAVVKNTPFAGNVVVLVRNEGNVLLPSNQQIKIRILAHDTTTDLDTILVTTANLSVGSLKSNGTKSFTVNVNSLTGLPSDNYEIQALIMPVQTLPEDDTVNNLINVTASSQKFHILSADPFINLNGFLGTSSVPNGKPANTALSGSLKVTVRNAGNIALVNGQGIQFQILAVSNSSTTSLVDQSATFSISKLAPNKTLTFSVPIKFTAGLATGQYMLEAVLISVPNVVQSDVGDDILMTNASGNNVGLTVI